jgi:hypothetical protein
MRVTFWKNCTGVACKIARVPTPGTLVANDPDVKLIPVDMVRAKYGADPVLTKKRHRVDRYS